MMPEKTLSPEQLFHRKVEPAVAQARSRRYLVKTLRKSKPQIKKPFLLLPKHPTFFVTEK